VSNFARATAAHGLDALDDIDALITSTRSGYSFDSSAVSSAFTELSDAADTLDQTLDDVYEILVDPRDTILDIVSTLNDIINQTNGVFDMAQGLLRDESFDVPAVPMLTDGQPVNGLFGITGILEQQGPLLGSVFFVLALVSLPFTVFGILVMGPKCAHRPHDNQSKTLYVLPPSRSTPPLLALGWWCSALIPLYATPWTLVQVPMLWTAVQPDLLHRFIHHGVRRRYSRCGFIHHVHRFDRHVHHTGKFWGGQRPFPRRHHPSLFRRRLVWWR